LQREFIARGLESRDNARRTGVYINADTVVNRLQAMLDEAKSGPNGRSMPSGMAFAFSI
jgi:hypothetical protein